MENKDFRMIKHSSHILVQICYGKETVLPSMQPLQTPLDCVYCCLNGSLVERKYIFLKHNLEQVLLLLLALMRSRYRLDRVVQGTSGYRCPFLLYVLTIVISPPIPQWSLDINGFKILSPEIQKVLNFR